ncbi:MAG: mechanosensitive ion channel [Clostridiales bacterium]|nr:mechanosensitive ion channel [Clostridiales bacterium]
MLEKIIESVTSFALNAGVKILISVAILVVGFKLIKFLTKKIKTAQGTKHSDPSVKSFLVSFVNIALKIVLIVTVAAYLGVPMASMITVLGSAGVAVGLALQGGLSNIAGGIMILAFRPFSVGDYIDCGESSGTVHAIGIFHTTLITSDSVRITIPNSVLTSSTVANYSIEKVRRLDLEFRAAYNANPDIVKNALLNAARSSDMVLRDPSPKADMLESTAVFTKYRLRIWCDRDDYYDVQPYLREAVKMRLDEASAAVQYPGKEKA